MDNQDKKTDMEISENHLQNEENNDSNNEKLEASMEETETNTKELDVQTDVQTIAQEENKVMEKEDEKPTKKKRTGVVVALITALVLIFAGSATAYANRGKITNTIAMMTKSASDYFAYVERKNTNKHIDAFTEFYGINVDQYKNGIATDNSLTIRVSPEIAMMVGLTEIKPIHAQFESSMKNGSSHLNGVFSYNEKTLASLEMLFDMNSSDYYFKIPELSDAYLLLSMTNIMDKYTGTEIDIDYDNYMKEALAFFKGDLISEKELNTLLKNYTSKIYNNITDVEVEKNGEITASGVTGKFNRIVTTITEKDVHNIIMSILTDAKEDKELMNLLVGLSTVTEEEYMETIEDLISTMKEEEEEVLQSKEPVFKMIVYVDDNGNIIGREINTVGDEESSFGYVIARNGSDLGFHFWVDKEKNEAVEITGDGKVSKDGFTGNAIMGVTTLDPIFDQSVTETLHVDLEGVKIKNQKIDGTFTISAGSFMGVEYVLDFESKDKQQDMTLKLMSNGMEALSLQISSKEVAFKEVKLPSTSEQIYDITTELDAYLQGADIGNFFTNIQDALGEDLGFLFDALIPEF